MATIEDLPFDVICLLMTHVLDDPSGFVNLSSTSKKFLRAANQVVNSNIWTEKRFIKFYIMEHDVGRQEKVLRAHPPRRSHLLRCDCGASEECLFNELCCLIQAKYRKFNHLDFNSRDLTHWVCFEDAINVNKFMARRNLDAIVELAISDCRLDLECLYRILNELSNLSYLSVVDVDINDVKPDDCNYLETAKTLRTLKELKIRDKATRFTDLKFKFFLKYLPVECLDLSTMIVSQTAIIRRFYLGLPNDIYDPNSSEFFTAKPSNNIFTLPMILAYLRTHKSTVKRLLSRSKFCPKDLTVIVKDPDLQHLKISLVDGLPADYVHTLNPSLTPNEWSRVTLKYGYNFFDSFR